MVSETATILIALARAEWWLKGELYGGDGHNDHLWMNRGWSSLNAIIAESDKYHRLSIWVNAELLFRDCNRCSRYDLFSPSNQNEDWHSRLMAWWVSNQWSNAITLQETDLGSGPSSLPGLWPLAGSVLVNVLNFLNYLIRTLFVLVPKS